MSPNRHGQPTYRASVRARIAGYFVPSYHCFALPVSSSAHEFLVKKRQYRDISQRPAPESSWLCTSTSRT